MAAAIEPGAVVPEETPERRHLWDLSPQELAALHKAVREATEEVRAEIPRLRLVYKSKHPKTREAIKIVKDGECNLALIRRVMETQKRVIEQVAALPVKEEVAG